MERIRTIRVTGKGKINVKPDMTRITLSLEGILNAFESTYGIALEKKVSSDMTRPASFVHLHGSHAK